MADYYPLRRGQPRWGMEMMEHQLDRALQVANVPGEALRQLPAPLMQVQAFRQREGLPLKQQRQIHIEDIIDVNRIYNDPRIFWTGTPGGFTGASRNSNYSSL